MGLVDSSKARDGVSPQNGKIHFIGSNPKQALVRSSLRGSATLDVSKKDTRQRNRACSGSLDANT